MSIDSADRTLRLRSFAGRKGGAFEVIDADSFAGVEPSADADSGTPPETAADSSVAQADLLADGLGGGVVATPADDELVSHEPLVPVRTVPSSSDVALVGAAEAELDTELVVMAPQSCPCVRRRG